MNMYKVFMHANSMNPCYHISCTGMLGNFVHVNFFLYHYFVTLCSFPEHFMYTTNNPSAGNQSTEQQPTELHPTQTGSLTYNLTEVPTHHGKDLYNLRVNSPNNWYVHIYESEQHRAQIKKIDDNLSILG